MGRRFLRPVCRYRSRCVRPSSTFAGCHGAGVSARGPTYVAEEGSAASSKAQVLKSHRRIAARFESVYAVSESSNPQPALGAAIRVLREKKTATQEAVAQDAGITVAHLSKIERGLTNPTWGTVSAIAAALHVTVAKLARTAEDLKG
jgi:DNA-binding XRE family transcriptional regulator